MIHRTITSAGTHVLVLLSCSLLLAHPQNAGTPVRTAITAKRMVDVRAGRTIADVVILLEGNTIAGVGSNLSVPAGVPVMALGDVTVLPGLIDAHTHLLHQYYPRYGDDNANRILEMVQLGPARRALLGARLAREMLEAGFTSVRDLGNSSVNADIALRDAINNGDVIGPRMFVSTRALSPVGGQFQSMTPTAQQLLTEEYVPISGPEEARRAVRQAIYDGADCIKVIANSGSRRLSADEMDVIVAEARRAGLPVAVHATDGDGPAMMAAEAGATSIEHGYTISEAVLNLMASKDIFLVPTDAPGVTRYQDRIKRAVKAGVRIALGSDTYYEHPGMTRGQVSVGMYRTYVASGMSNLEVLRAATINPADLIGHRSLGALEAGRLADMIAVTGDPLADIGALEDVVFVMKDGKVIRRTF